MLFYKSTLTLSLSVATMFAAFGLFVSPRILLVMFAIGLMTGKNNIELRNLVNNYI
jgi:hypothetical protein